MHTIQNVEDSFNSKGEVRGGLNSDLWNDVMIISLILSQEETLISEKQNCYHSLSFLLFILRSAHFIHSKSRNTLTNCSLNRISRRSINNYSVSLYSSGEIF